MKGQSQGGLDSNNAPGWVNLFFEWWANQIDDLNDCWSDTSDRFFLGEKFHQMMTFFFFSFKVAKFKCFLLPKS